MMILIIIAKDAKYLENDNLKC